MKSADVILEQSLYNVSGVGHLLLYCEKITNNEFAFLLSYLSGNGATTGACLVKSCLCNN